MRTRRIRAARMNIRLWTVTQAISLVNWILPVLARWAGEDIPGVLDAKREDAERSERMGYVDGDPRISAWIFAAALDDAERQYQEEPEARQSTLNACMVCIRDDSIGGSWAALMGRLIASGHDPQEAFIRTAANIVTVGMFIQKRLSSDGAAAIDRMERGKMRPTA